MHEQDNKRTDDASYKKPLFNEEYKQPDLNQGDQTSPIHTTKHMEKPVETPMDTTIPIKEEPTPNTEAPEEQPAPAKERRPSREETNLKSDLGNYWKCTDHDPHYDGPIARRLRVRATDL